MGVSIIIIIIMFLSNCLASILPSTDLCLLGFHKHQNWQPDDMTDSNEQKQQHADNNLRPTFNSLVLTITTGRGEYQPWWNFSILFLRGKPCCCCCCISNRLIFGWLKFWDGCCFICKASREEAVTVCYWCWTNLFYSQLVGGCTLYDHSHQVQHLEYLQQLPERIPKFKTVSLFQDVDTWTHTSGTISCWEVSNLDPTNLNFDYWTGTVVSSMARPLSLYVLNLSFDGSFKLNSIGRVNINTIAIPKMLFDASI